jgi:hypothetical protein
MVAGALVSLGVAIWLLVVALARQSSGLVYLVGSLVADAASFGFLVLTLVRRHQDGSSPHPARA